MKADWHACAEKSGFSYKEVKRVHDLQESPLADSLANFSIDLGESLHVPGSPTLFINNMEVNERIHPYLIESLFCRGGEKKGGCADFPACGSDLDCLEKGREGICENPKESNAKCVYETPIPFEMTVYNDRDCITCNTGNIIEMILKKFRGVTIKHADIESREGRELRKKYNLEIYPSFVFDDAIARSRKFRQIKHTFEHVKDRYIVSPSVVKTYRFLERKAVKGKLDLFITAQHPYAIETVRQMEEWLNKNRSRVKFSFNIIAYPPAGTQKPSDWTTFYSSPHGRPEIMEGARLLCVQKMYGSKAYQYSLCRGFDVQARFNKRIAEPGDEWMSCVKQLKLNQKKIKRCVEGAEGQKLFMESVNLARRLNATKNVVFIVNNNWRVQDFNPPTWGIIQKELVE
jgi:hypothetical protein